MRQISENFHPYSLPFKIATSTDQPHWVLSLARPQVRVKTTFHQSNCSFDCMPEPIWELKPAVEVVTVMINGSPSFSKVRSLETQRELQRALPTSPRPQEPRCWRDLILSGPHCLPRPRAMKQRTIALASEILDFSIKTSNPGLVFPWFLEGFSLDPSNDPSQKTHPSAHLSPHLRKGAHTTIAQAVLAQREHLQPAAGQRPAAKALGQGHCTIKAQEIASRMGQKLHGDFTHC